MYIIKYLKYYISTVTLIASFLICFLGEFYPTAFFIGFSLFIILGDVIMKEDVKKQKFSHIFLLNLPMYINFPILFFIVLCSVFVLGNSNDNSFSNIILNYFHIDLVFAAQTINIVDTICLTVLMGLFIGIMGTVPGHELVHRKKKKFDMLMGDWLLAFSWDCAFAVEHVYGHHKNVGLPIDPATAKRGESIYAFIIRAIINEHRDAWKIELKQCKKKNKSPIGTHNRLLMGYFKSVFITIISYIIGGLPGMLIFLLFSFIAKSFLEVINYSEHYGLIRVDGEPVYPRHSWNSNSTMSSIYLYNVTRHSSHHEKANLKYWELESYKTAPMMPQGYLTMLYAALLTPYFFHRMMAKKLIDWDANYASKEERSLAEIQNKKSGISLLEDHSE